MSFRIAIVGRGRVPAVDLLAHPLNVKTHGLDQQADMSAILGAVGWVKTVLVNQRSGRILDGHMKTAIAASRDEEVPVRYCDLSDEDEALVLMAFDRVALMATTDTAKLSDVLHQIGDHDKLDDYLERLAAESGIEFEEPAASSEAPLTPPVVFAVGNLAWDVPADRYAEWLAEVGVAAGSPEQVVVELMSRLEIHL